MFLFIIFAGSVSVAVAGPQIKYGVVGARGVVLQDAGQGEKQPVWVEYNEKGEIVGKINVSASARAHAVAISRVAYLAYAAGDENWIPDPSVSLNENISTVLFNSATRQVIFASENNIGPWVAFVSVDGADPVGSHRQKTLFGYDLQDSLTNPVAGAQIECPLGGNGVTDESGRYGVSIYTYPSCFPYVETHAMYARMRFNKFDPDNPSGYYYLFQPFTLIGGGDLDVCSAMMGPTLMGQIAAMSISNIASSSGVTNNFPVNFTVDVAMLSGKGIMDNTIPAFGRDIPLDDTISTAVTLADTTAYQAVKTAAKYIPPEAPLDHNSDGIPDYFEFDENTGVVNIWVDGLKAGEPDMTLQAEREPVPPSHSGLLASISTADLQNTDIYVFRVSNDQLMAARAGLDPSESSPYYGGGALKGEPGVYYKMLMRGPASFYSPFIDEEEILEWAKIINTADKSSGFSYDNIRPGEAIKVFLVNRATGYMGSAITSFGNLDAPSTPINFIPNTITMGPPNIRINVERHHEIKTGVTAGESKDDIIGFEGSGLTSDDYIKVTTEWTDADGSPLPPGLEGFTGRLAKVVDENTLQSTGSLANFEIKPGRHTEMIQLPQGGIDKAHYYIHISGEKIQDNPDFSSLGGGAAGDLLEYRPRHFVPFMVPLYDKENSPSIHEPKHQWVFRPEMQFSLFDLEKMEYEYENQETGKTEIIDLLEDTAGAALPVLSDLDLVYKLLSDENTNLLPFGPDRELILSFGDQQLLITLNDDGEVAFKYLNNADVAPEDYLALRLYQNGDNANILWEYAFGIVDLDIDSDNNNQYDQPDFSDQEEALENNKNAIGKLVAANIGDADQDLKPDYIDFSIAGNPDDYQGRFVPMILKLPEDVNPGAVKIRFKYAGSDPTTASMEQYPPNEGKFRIWTKDATEERVISEDTDYVIPNEEYQGNDLSFQQNNQLTLYIEGIDIIDNDDDKQIVVEVDPDGDDGDIGFILKDTVRITVITAELAVDGNRDGDIKFARNQIGKIGESLLDPDEMDTTYDWKSYRFWLNNDADGAATDLDPDRLEPDRKLDNEDDLIANQRDLEDFTRMQMQLLGLKDEILNGEITVGLEFDSQVTDGEPEIRIFSSYESSASIKYIFDEGYASKQVKDDYRKALGKLSNPDKFDLPKSDLFWSSLTVDPEGKKCLLFEGVKEGSGPVSLVLKQGNQEIYKSPPVYLELKDIKDMYERYYVDGLAGVDCESVNNCENINSMDPLTISDHAGIVDGEFTYDENSPEEKDYILFVHGWRMKPWEKIYFAETAYKRLFWQGYKGRFGFFSWPTEWTSRNWPTEALSWWTDLIPHEPQNYSRSERKARISGKALHNVFHDLKSSYPGTVRVFAHSMGNVVVSEALRHESIAGGADLLHTYIASQAASTAHSYERSSENGTSGPEPNAVNDVIIGEIQGLPEDLWDFFTRTTPESYSDYPPTGQTYYGNINDSVGRIYNFHNVKDSALSGWRVQQLLKPDVGWCYNCDHGLNVPEGWKPDSWLRLEGYKYVELNFSDDTYEIFGHMAEAQSAALGAAVYDNFSVRGPIAADVNLNFEPYNFDDSSEDHSAQFLKTNMDRSEYWSTLLEYFEIVTNDR